MFRRIALSLTVLACTAGAAERQPVGSVPGLTGPKPIYARCSSPKAGQKAMAGTVTVPRGVEPACGAARVRAHVEWAWGGPPSAVAVHAYWVKDARPLREIERQLKANGWRLDGRLPSTGIEQVRYTKARQEVTLQYSDPALFSYPDYRREGRFLEMVLLRF